MPYIFNSLSVKSLRECVFGDVDGFVRQVNCGYADVEEMGGRRGVFSVGGV